MIHDWAVTQNFVIFPIIPLRTELDWIKRGESYFQWNPDEDVYLGVLPRKGRGEDVRWYKASNRFASHIMGAYDDGRHIHIDTPVGATNYFPWFPDLTGAPYDPVRSKGYLSRWTIDTRGESRSFAETRLSELPGEFPRMDDRRETLPYTWGIMLLTDVPGRVAPGGGFRWLSGIDLTTGRQQIYYPGDGCTLGEGVFVPAAPDAPPGVGYVLVVVGRRREMRSDLVILDAQRLDGEPVCTLSLPMRIRMGVHGGSPTWTRRAWTTRSCRSPRRAPRCSIRDGRGRSRRSPTSGSPRPAGPIRRGSPGSRRSGSSTRRRRWPSWRAV